MMAANPNVYNRRYGGSSHDYDTIPDVLAEMQVNVYNDNIFLCYIRSIVCDTPLLSILECLAVVCTLIVLLSTTCI